MATTEEQIKKRINDRLTIDANKLEGGFSQDIIGSVAYELANIEDVDLNKLADKCFVKTAKGDDLDKVGSDYGIPRREASAALVYLKITGDQFAVVNSQVKAVYNNLVYNVLEYKKIGADGVVTVKAKCDTLGVVGNVPENSIVAFATDYVGLKTVTNPEAAFDGFDKEDDEVYRQRILTYLETDATNANAAQYKKWALEITGVQKAIIKSADTMGAGNVGVYISAIDTTVSDELIQEVKTYIESVQPINATVLVQSLDYVNMDVNATVVLKPMASTIQVKEEFTKLLAKYLANVDKVVSYLRISDILFSCSGVEDVVEYTLNGGKLSIEITDTQYPVVGAINVITR